MGITCSIDTHFVQFNIVHGTYGKRCVLNQYTIEILPDRAIIIYRNKVSPTLSLNITKGVRLIVVQSPFATNNSMLEGSI